MNDVESIDENTDKKASMTNKFSSSSILLSLVARASTLACMLHSDLPPSDGPLPPVHACAEELRHSSSPYGIEFSHITYGCLLTLIDKNKGEFCSNMELSLSGMNSKTNNYLRSSFDSDQDKSLPLPSTKFSRTNPIKNSTNIDLLNSHGQLSSCLTILQSNLTILSNHIIKCNFIYKKMRKIESEKKRKKEKFGTNLSMKENEGIGDLTKKKIWDPYGPGMWSRMRMFIRLYVYS
jgi:hypothetical protein